MKITSSSLDSAPPMSDYRMDCRFCGTPFSAEEGEHSAIYSSNCNCGNGMHGQLVYIGPPRDLGCVTLSQ